MFLYAAMFYFNILNMGKKGKHTYKVIKIGKYEVSSNWKLLFIIIILLVVLAIILFLLINKKPEEIPNKNITIKKCSVDSDCIKISTSCCPCSMGGNEKCVYVLEKDEALRQKINCPKDLICTAMYACNIESCSCENGECVSNLE